jgi:hypothetical protein
VYCVQLLFAFFFCFVLRSGCILHVLPQLMCTAKKIQAGILMSGHNKGLPVEMTKVEGSDIMSRSLS